ncbi:MAG: AsmA family protein [Dysgonamonadaceae bacterium]|jgi:hypothetical protein|nr:AsmA family protein [Dysgonamonadaceae bacterium]
MKKFLKIAGITLLVIVLLLAVLPFAFKGKIIEIAKKEINKSMNARIDFEHLGLNFFKSFPNASVSLENFYIAGVDEFEGDTLFFAENLSATVNIKSLFGNSGYEIIRVGLENARLHAVVHEDGKANWNIVPETETEMPADTTESALKLSLKKVSIRNTGIYFDNDSSRIYLAVENLNLDLSGDMTADETRIQTGFTIEALTFVSDNIPFLSKARINSKINVDADLKNNTFTLADNSIEINAVKVGIDGRIALPEKEGMEIELKLNAPSIQFKDVLSLIPAIYSKDFDGLKTSGEATLNASAKGRMQGEELPAFDVNLTVADAFFQYPGMPKSVTGIQADIRASNPGGTADNTTVAVSKFHFELVNNPFDLKLHLSHPVSDPDLTLSAVGKLDLGMLKEVYPLDNMDLSGKLDANLQLATRMSAIQKEQYENVNASGTLHISQLTLQSEDLPDIRLNNAKLAFSPRYVDLSAFEALIGKNDIAASGKLENFIPYFLKNETLKGKLSVTSNYLNLNDFMKGSENSASAEDTTALALFEIPKNIRFNLDANLKQVLFDNMDIRNLTGQILVYDGKVDMKNLSLNALGGTLNIDGYYDTGKNPQQPDVSFDLKLKNVSFAETFSTFVTIRKLAPIFENLKGNFSTNLHLTAPIGEGFMPILTSLIAGGSLQSNQVEITEAGVLTGLAGALGTAGLLKNESMKELKVKDINLPFDVANGRVTTKPFDVKFGSGNMNLSGSTGLDQTIDYTAKVDLSDKLSNNYVKNISVKIGGTFTKPSFHVDTKGIADQALGALAGSILGTGSESSLNEQVNEQIDKQIENIRKEAKNAGDKLVAEAEKEGKKLIDEANKVKNPLAKIAAVKAAEAGAKKLKEEAQKKADQLNAEAEKQIDSIRTKN